MARSFGRILNSIWGAGSDFRTLDVEAQRLYMFLVSQPNIRYTGLLPIALRKWAATAQGLTVADLERTLTVLDQARYVVVDWDTEELLVRTLVRNDDIWKMPYVMRSMVASAEEIESPRLRRALLAEVDRIPLDELSDEPSPKGGPSVRHQVAVCISNLRKAFDNPDGDPFPTGSERVSERVSGTVSETSREGSAEPSTRAHVRASPLTMPLTLTSPSPTPSTTSSSPAASPPDDQEMTKPPRLDVEQLCNRLVELMVANGNKPPKITKAWRDEARRLFDIDERDLQKALAVLDWCQKDAFWNTNIHSIPKFRQQYDKLRSRAIAEWQALPHQRQGDGPGTDAHFERTMHRAEAREAAMREASGS